MGLFQRNLLSSADSATYSALHGDREEDRLRVLAQVLADATEFSQVPVRHNEDLLNADLAKVLPWRPKGNPEVSIFVILIVLSLFSCRFLMLVLTQGFNGVTAHQNISAAASLLAESTSAYQRLCG